MRDFSRIMSRRKQRHPKSMKEDQMLFIVPPELQYDENTNEIITRVDLERDYCVGTYPAIFQIEDRIESFHLLDIKHNWLACCSSVQKSSANLNLIFQNNLLVLMVKESIPMGTRLYSNKIIRPKLKDIQIKEEPIEREMKKSLPLIFVCERCGIQFSNRNILEAHREHYCLKQVIRKSHSIESTITSGVKRKSTDNSSIVPSKRSTNETYCSECDISFSKSDNFIQHKLHYCPTTSNSSQSNEKTIPFNRPIQIGQFIYVPIPVVSSQIDNRPLDLTTAKTKSHPLEKQTKNLPEKFYQCEFCSIHFRLRKTLQAHQNNYCIAYQKQKLHDNISSQSFLFTCRLCKYRDNTLRGMHIHFKYHSLNNESCSDDDILLESNSSNECLLKCTICLAMFNDETTLLNHIRCVHTNPKLIECLECRSRFCSKWNLFRHMKLLHTNINSDDEDKSSDSINLISQKYSCPSCHIPFAQFDTLMQHMNNYCHHSQTIINDRKSTSTYCSSCEISFRHKASYKAHKLYYCPNEKIST